MSFCSLCGREGGDSEIAPDPRGEGRPVCIDDVLRCDVRAQEMAVKAQQQASTKRMKSWVSGLGKKLLSEWRRLSPWTKKSHVKHGRRAKVDQPAKPRRFPGLTRTKTTKLNYAEQILLTMERKQPAGWRPAARRALRVRRAQLLAKGKPWSWVKLFRMRPKEDFLRSVGG